nr:hypothetical protein [Nannocystis sp.]
MHADQADAGGLLAGDDAGGLEAVLDGLGLAAEGVALADLAGQLRQDLLQVVDEGRGDRRTHAAGAQPVAAEAAAADPHRRVDRGGADAAVGGGALQEADVCRQAGEADQVHGDALQLEADGAVEFDGGVDGDAGERLDRAGVGPGVGDRGVAGDALDQRGQVGERALEQQALDAAVLVAVVDLEVVDDLAMAAEAERAGLDHAGVDRADVDLVDLLALDVEKTRSRSCARGSCPRSGPA